MELAGKHVVVTGAASGIGRASAMVQRGDGYLLSTASAMLDLALKDPIGAAPLLAGGLLRRARYQAPSAQAARR